LALNSQINAPIFKAKGKIDINHRTFAKNTLIECTPITIAIYENDVMKLKFLIEHGANVNIQPDCTSVDSIPYLFVAAIRMKTNQNSPKFTETLECFRILLSAGCDPKIVDNHGRTLLIWAAMDNLTELIPLLLEVGTDVNAIDNKGYTALMYAASRNRNNEVITMLSKAGANLEVINENGKTAFLEAASKQKFTCLENLMKCGANRNATDKNGNNAIICLIQGSKHTDKNNSAFEDCLKLLFSCSNVDTSNNVGDTALLKTITKGKGNNECLKMLIEAGSDMNRTLKDGKTGLIYASKNNMLDYAKLLLEKGADQTLLDKTGNTALFYAKTDDMKSLLTNK